MLQFADLSLRNKGPIFHILALINAFMLLHLNSGSSRIFLEPDLTV